jgi:hypothetical protein
MFGSKKSILDVSLSGSMYALTLELYLGNSAVDTDYSYSDGVIISIENQTYVPFTKSVAIKAQAGAETDLVIDRNFISRLPLPYSVTQSNTT